MAISQLIQGQQSTQTPTETKPKESVSAYFGVNKPKTESLTKTSNMFGENFMTGASTSMNELTIQLNKLQENSKKLIITVNKLVRDVKALHKDVISKFRAFSAELSSSKADLTRAAVAETPKADMTGLDLGAPVSVPSTETTPTGTPTKDSGLGDITGIVSGIVSGLLPGLLPKLLGGANGILAGLMGGGNVLSWLTGLATSTLGGAFIAAASGGLAALAATMFAAAGLGDFIEDWFGIKKKIAEREKTDEYKELQRAQGDISAGMGGVGSVTVDAEGKARDAEGTERTVAGAVADRATRDEQRKAIVEKYKLKISNLSQDPNNINIIIDKKSGKRYYLPTQSELPESGATTTTPAAPAATPAAPTGGGPQSGVDPDVAKRAAEYTEMGKKGVPLPNNIAADPLHGKMALTAWQEGQKQAGGTGPATASYGKPAGAGSDKPVTPPQPPSSIEGEQPAASAGAGGDDIANKAAQYREMGRRGIPLPPGIGADPIAGKLAITEWQEGQKEVGTTGAPKKQPPRNLRGVKLYDEQGDGAVGEQLAPGSGRRERQTAEALTYNPMTGEKLKGEGLSGVRSRALGGRQAAAGAEDKAGMERISIGADGQDYSAYNQTRWIDKDIMGEKVQVPIYYNPITNKQYSPESGQKSAERMRPELLRGRMEQFDRQQDVASMQSAEEMRMRGSVRPLEPIVMNNNSSTSVGSTSGAESNNVSGQNFPMEVSNPAITPFLARQNVEYQ